MNDIKLNVGGAIGGLLGAGIIFLLFFEPNNDAAGARVAKLVILAVVVGAVAGNFLWGSIFKKPPTSETDDEATRFPKGESGEPT